MSLEEISFNGKVTNVLLGNGEKSINLGGQATLPFLDTEYTPKLALHIADNGLAFPQTVEDPYTEFYDNIVEWAKYCEKTFAIDSLHVKFTEEANVTEYLPVLLKELSIPLIISGPSDVSKNQLILNHSGEIGEGKNLLLCAAELETYKSIAATALAYNHCVVALSPIDVNIAKQLNILLTDFGLPLNRIVIDPMVAALGYGLEYTYSAMERIRALGLAGDDMLSSPIICFVQDSWRARETAFEYPDWGPISERGFLWEASTALSLFAAGGDLFVFRHPESLLLFKKTIGV